jgi:hypothetical protein
MVRAEAQVCEAHCGDLLEEGFADAWAPLPSELFRKGPPLGRDERSGAARGGGADGRHHGLRLLRSRARTGSG